MSLNDKKYRSKATFLYEIISVERHFYMKLSVQSDILYKIISVKRHF